MSKILKNSLDGINSGLDITDESTSEFVNIAVEAIWDEKQNENDERQ